jgi:DNA-directed RNA polymerase specialized sigma24 family protein
MSSTAADDLAGTFRAHRAELVRLAAFILADRGAGEDVVQDVFARMHGRHGGIAPLEDRGSALPYLRRAVVNGCRSALRRQRLIRRHAEQSPCPTLTAEEAALLSDERRQILAALAALPRRRREVMPRSGFRGSWQARVAGSSGRVRRVWQPGIRGCFQAGGRVAVTRGKERPGRPYQVRQPSWRTATSAQPASCSTAA